MGGGRVPRLVQLLTKVNEATNTILQLQSPLNKLPGELAKEIKQKGPA